MTGTGDYLGQDKPCRAVGRTVDDAWFEDGRCTLCGHPREAHDADD